MEIRKINGERAKIAHYLRSAFSGDDGRGAFVWIMRRCMHFTKIETEEDRALYNFGVELLEAMGVYHLPHEADLAEGLLKLPLIEE